MHVYQLELMYNNINQTERLKELKKASDLSYLERPPIATREQYDLFNKYQTVRHYDSDMATMTFSEYRSMVEDTPVETYLYEFRDNDNYLVAASLTDKVTDGLSGIYKFFHPDRSKDSIGTWLIDWHIEEAKKIKVTICILRLLD